MIFIDTGAFLARYSERDQHHKTARRAWKELSKRKWRYYTSNFVLDETFTLLARRTNYLFAVERARIMMTSDVLNILRPSHEEELEAIEYFDKYSDQKVSFTDCTSFVLMRRNRIKRAFAFDRHFSDAGFEVWPGDHP